MRLLFIRIITCLILFGCDKNHDAEIVKTFNGDLPIVSTLTPTTAIAGQEIRSRVTCELTSISGSVFFQGFEVRETSAREFSFSAKALYKDWNMQIGMPMMWTLDTVVSIPTTIRGTYLLKFYNASHLVKSDTVQVN